MDRNWQSFLDAFAAGEIDCTVDADGLYVVDSLLDAVCRGAAQEDVIDRFHVDCGYHMTQTSNATKGVDRRIYKLTHVRVRCGVDAVKAVIEAYANGASREACLPMLGIADKRLTLRDIAAEVGLMTEFKAADRMHRKNAMRDGMMAKYGVDNPFKLGEFQDQAAATRVARYGAPYTFCNESVLCEDARNTFNRHMEDGGFRALMKLRKMLSCYAHTGSVYPVTGSDGHRVLALPSGRTYRGKRADWDREDRLAKARATSIDRFGVDHHSKTQKHKEYVSALWEEHHDEWVERAQEGCIARYGVAHYWSTDEAREAQRQRMLDPRYQHHLNQVRKQNGTFRTSSSQDWLYVQLCEAFGVDDVEQEYCDDGRYPYNCDFYIKSRDLFIELNGFHSHGGRWCDDDEDQALAAEWAESDSAMLRRSSYVWRTYDLEKRECARLHKLNYVVFWDATNGASADAELWFALGCPDGCDWDRMYSWLPERTLSADFVWPQAVKGVQSAIDAAKAANGHLFYAQELSLWNENKFHGVRANRAGTPQAWLYANRWRYLGKLPQELTDRELLRGFKISCLHVGYSSFNATAMLEVIDKYNVSSILDPCAGWGERLAIAGSLGLKYHGCDVNAAVVDGHAHIVTQYGFTQCDTVVGDGATIENIYGANVAITCPPYGNTEIYTDYGAETLAEIEFLDWWASVGARVVACGVKLFAFQVNDIWRDRMLRAIEKSGWQLIDEIAVKAESMPVRRMKQGRKRTAKETMLVLAI